MECAVSQNTRHQTRTLNYLQRGTNCSNRPKRSKRSYRPKPGTQGDTSVTSLRKQKSKLPCKHPRDKTVHMECAVSQNTRHQTRTLNHLQSSANRSNRPKRSKWSYRPKPGTQGDTSVTSLRKQKSKLPCKRPQIRGSAQDVRCRHCAKDGAFGGYPAPPLGAYTVSLLCVVSTERCVTQVPYFPNFATLNVDTIKKAKNAILTG